MWKGLNNVKENKSSFWCSLEFILHFIIVSLSLSLSQCVSSLTHTNTILNKYEYQSIIVWYNVLHLTTFKVSLCTLSIQTTTSTHSSHNHMCILNFNTISILVTIEIFNRCNGSYGREGLLTIIHLKLFTWVFLMEPTRREGLFCSIKPTIRSQVFYSSEQYFLGIFVSMTLVIQ